MSRIRLSSNSSVVRFSNVVCMFLSNDGMGGILESWIGVFG